MQAAAATVTCLQPLCCSVLTSKLSPQLLQASKRWCKTLPVELVDKALLSFAHNG